MEIAVIEQQARELEGNLQLVENQILELESFKENLNLIVKSKEKEMLASLGKRVFVKTSIEDKDKLFVDVGAGVIIKKTPEETIKVVSNQILRLQEARLQISAQLEIYHKHLEEFIKSIGA